VIGGVPGVVIRMCASAFGVPVCDLRNERTRSGGARRPTEPAQRSRECAVAALYMLGVPVCDIRRACGYTGDPSVMAVIDRLCDRATSRDPDVRGRVGVITRTAERIVGEVRERYMEPQELRETVQPPAQRHAGKEAA
jgi:hypothetical protein